MPGRRQGGPSQDVVEELENLDRAGRTCSSLKFLLDYLLKDLKKS